MKVENTSSMIDTMVRMNVGQGIQRQHPQSETPDKVFINTMQEIKGAIKTYKPPYFPIGDTQAIFKK
jgi:hypothetical protein